MNDLNTCIVLQQHLSYLSWEAEHQPIMTLEVEYELLEYLMALHVLESILLRETITLI